MARGLPARSGSALTPCPSWIAVGLLVAAYWLTARFGLAYPVVGTNVTLAWLPSGLALGALLRFGTGLWPGVFLAALGANLSVQTPPLAALGIATGNTLEALVGARLFLRLASGRAELAEVRSIFVLLIAAGISGLLAASLGPAALLLWGHLPQAEYLDAALYWWMGDHLGVLLVAPAMLVWFSPGWMRPARLAEALVLASALALSAYAIFGGPEISGRGYYPAALLLFPFFLWGALRFDLRGASGSILLAAPIAILGTASGTGPLYAPELTDSLLRWWLFVYIMGLTSLLIAIIGERRRQAEAALRESHRTLETRVQQRTRALTQTADELRQVVAEREQLEREIIRISEDEHRQFSRELHDGLGQQLSGIAMLAASLEARLVAEGGREETSPTAGLSGELSRQIAAAVASARGLAQGLYPAGLEGHNLGRGLEQLSQRIQNLHSIPVRLRCRYDDRIGDEQAAVHLYRIAQEAAGNAARHGGPSRIRIAFCAQGVDAYTLLIADNGVGRLAAMADRNDGLGLRIMRYRARLIGAEFALSQRKGGGLRVSVVRRP